MYIVIGSDYNSSLTGFIDFTIEFDSFVSAVKFCKLNQNLPVSTVIQIFTPKKIRFPKY